MNLFKSKDGYVQNKQVGADYILHVPPGTYHPKDLGGMGTTIYAFNPVNMAERVVEFTNGPIGELLSVIPKFFSPSTIEGYKEMGIAHKMGLLMHGPPGTGKTITARILMNRLVVDYNAVCLLATGRHPTFIKGMAQYLRSIQPNPIIIFYDEFDYVIDNCEEDLLTFLDGQDSVDGCIVIGCTNFIDKIPERIKNRPSRIKHTVEIKALPMSVYQDFIADKLPSMEKDKQIELAYRAESDALTLDQVKHVLIDYRIDNISFDQSIASVKTKN